MSAVPKTDFLAGYQPKTPYYAVQRAALEFVLERPYAGVFLPPRRGKTKVAIDKCAFWYQNGRRIDAILVLAAPNGVHRNFVTDEVPAHLPDGIPRRCLVWRSGKHKTAAYAREMKLLLGFRGMAVLSVNAEALSTIPCRNYIKQFLAVRKIGLVADECFISGTLIDAPLGQRKIEEICVGDLITTPSGAKTVLGIRKTSATNLVRITTNDGCITCTPNHPFFTDVGWVSAGNLEGRYLYDSRAVMCNLREIIPSEVLEQEEILRECLLCEMELEPTEIPRKNAYQSETQSNTIPNWSSGYEPWEIGRFQPWKTGMEPRDTLVGRIQETSERNSNISGKRLFGSTWWQRAFDAETAESFANGIRLAVDSGTRHTIGRKAAWLSNLLQGRFSVSGRKISSGGGWSKPRKTSSSGREEGCKVIGIRVDRVESIECASPTIVYDLHVSGDHRYFANGKLVHNSSFWMRKAGTARTRLAKTISRHPSVMFRMILDGTPTGEKPLDLYSQIMFLSEKVFGFTSRFAFDSYYAEWEEKVNHGTGQAYRTVKQYRNLDVMRERLDTCCFQATREECSDFPPKVYQRVYFQLSDEQRRVYDELRDEYEAELAGGDRVTATHVLTRYLRLQQVGSNYWPSRSAAVICNDCEGNGCHMCDDIGVVIKEIPEREIGPSNPRLVALHNELVKPDTGPFIVWARFIHDVDKVFALGRELGFDPVRYDGEVPDRERAAGLATFQAGRSYMLVGNQGAGGRGLRMDKARTMIYYSNDFSRLTREHSEERAEAVGGSAATSVLDLIAEDTVDIHIVEAHRSKMALSELIYSTKDRVPGKWLK